MPLGHISNTSSTAPALAASSTSIAAVDLRSTTNRPVPSATPVASGAGAPPTTAPSGGTAATADGISFPDAKPAILEGPCLEKQDLSTEDKAKFFDRMAEQVWKSLFFRNVLERGSAPNGSSPRGCDQSLVIGCSRRFSLSLLLIFARHWGHGSAPDGSSPRGCEQSVVIG